jgi:predicted nucleic acid-binding Zn ribbon protein
MRRLEALRSAATEALRRLLDSQPTSSAKVGFAWRMAAGPALANAVDTEWRDDDGVLRVRAKTPTWLKELRHARPILTVRIAAMLGPDVVKKLVIE